MSELVEGVTVEVARIQKLAPKFQQALFLSELLHPVPVWRISTDALQTGTFTAPAFTQARCSHCRLMCAV